MGIKLRLLKKFFYTTGGLSVAAFGYLTAKDLTGFRYLSIEGILGLIVLAFFYLAWCDLIDHIIPTKKDEKKCP